jgi:hypothetical protein
MRAPIFAAALVALGVLAVPANASADMPGYGELPSGHATAPPDASVPASIPAREKVPGFFVATPSLPARRSKMAMKPGMKGPSKPSYVLVVANEERQKKIQSGELGGRDNDDNGPCFSEARRFTRPPPPDPTNEDADGGEEASLLDWDEGLGPQAMVQLETEDNPRGGVTAVHRERLVTEGSATRLEIVDVWVDPATKGVRKIGESTIPLKMVGSSRGLSVYAARDERDKVKAVQFVIVPPNDLPNGRSEGLVAVRGDGRNTTSSSCSHLRVAMNAADGAADSALLKATLRLPEHGDGERTEENGEKRVRLREAAIQLGLSKAKRDREPIVSVTFGWAGRETSQIARGED